MSERACQAWDRVCAGELREDGFAGCFGRSGLRREADLPYAGYSLTAGLRRLSGARPSWLTRAGVSALGRLTLLRLVGPLATLFLSPFLSLSVFLYTAPVFTALGLHALLPGERLRPLQWLGIALAFSGIAFAFAGGISWQHLDRRMLLGDAMGLMAGLCWGATTVVVRTSRLSEAPVALTLFYQLIVCVAGLLVIALATGQFSHVTFTPIGTASVLFQGVVVSFASFLIWFWLLRRYLASNLAVFSFMTPLFGVTFGVVLLGEPLSMNFILGAVCVLLGITLVSAEQWVRRRLRIWIT